MPAPASLSGWTHPPLLGLPSDQHEAHVRYCSLFANDLLNRYPHWQEGLDQHRKPEVSDLQAEISQSGLDAGLRLYRNRQMLRIIWRDLCGLSCLAETFSDLTSLAEISLQAAVDAHYLSLQQKFGTPRAADGSEQKLLVIGMGKFGGGELNLSSDIDVIFCYPHSGECDGRRKLANEQFFSRQARAVIASLSDLNEHGFCFRVDTRLRPFGDSGPLTCSLAAMELYYQREGRSWERYALIKARPVAGDCLAGALLLRNLRPFVYRRYIDFGSVEALQEMHASVQEDALRKDRLDDIKRGPGGIREIEFLAQCFQILRGGREVSLQTPALDQALNTIAALGLMSDEAVAEVRRNYIYLRLLENRIQALRDQQIHRLPRGEDLRRISRAMGEQTPEALATSLATTRQQVSTRFGSIFPAQPATPEIKVWGEKWRQLRGERQGIEVPEEPPDTTPMAIFLRQLERFDLSERAAHRLDRFMPVLLEHIDSKSLDDTTLNRIFDLVLTTCRRSAYLVLLVQHLPALERMLDLFARSEWIADKVIRFPALLDELIQPSLGKQIPSGEDLSRSVDRLLAAAQDPEVMLTGLNELKLATSLRIAVAHLAGTLSAQQAQQALSNLAAAVLQGVLKIAAVEIETRHGYFHHPGPPVTGQDHASNTLAIIAYGTLGAGELGYESDLDIVFLFEAEEEKSNGPRPLTAERYYARLAQRVLSFLTVTTSSGRLYDVDTRLRPNGRAGALVSSFAAFQEYQLNEAWTWEMQAMTRARFIAGDPRMRSRFERVRQNALCRNRTPNELQSCMLDMRRKMVREQTLRGHEGPAFRFKHGPGGLVDIEFIAQFGVLSTALSHPRVVQVTDSLSQLAQLSCIGWLTIEDAELLIDVARKLSQQRMMSTLIPGEATAVPETRASARLFARVFGGSARQ